MKYLVEKVILAKVNGGGHMRTRSFDVKEIIEDVEKYRKEMRENNNVDRVLLNYQEMERTPKKIESTKEIYIEDWDF
jgi:hypothetical protein